MVGYFHTTSPLGSSQNPNPILSLASNIILDVFGPTVQTVADCLLYRFGPKTGYVGVGEEGGDGDGITLTQIISSIHSVCSRRGIMSSSTTSSSRNQNPSSTSKNYHVDIGGNTSERDRLLKKLLLQRKSDGVDKGRNFNKKPQFRWNTTKGSEERGFIADDYAIRVALLVLVHHSLVKVLIFRGNTPTNSLSSGDNQQQLLHKYSIDINRILLLPRYCRYVEWTKTKIFSNNSGSSSLNSSVMNAGTSSAIGSILVEDLCVKGRMTTQGLVLYAFEQYEQQRNNIMTVSQSNLNKENNEKQQDHHHQQPITTVASNSEIELKAVVDVLKHLIERGFIEMIPPLLIDNEGFVGGQDEAELRTGSTINTNNTLSGQKRPIESVNAADSTNIEVFSSKQLLSKILQAPRYRMVFPVGAVWRINVEMFHAHLRSHYLGRLVAERFGDQVQYAGSFISAALKLVAHREHSPLVRCGIASSSVLSTKQERRQLKMNGETTVFSPDEVIDFLPPQVVASFKAKAGGARSNLSAALAALCKCSNPQVLMEVESIHGHPLGGKFEVSIRSMVEYTKHNIVRQLIRDQHGDVAVRICTILESRGYSESESVAEAAMVPAKDAREVLHRLYKSNYVTLLNLQQTKQYNAGTAIYLWGVISKRLHKVILQNICKALCNVRLRRQHEVQIGREWIERAKEAGVTDENEVEMDKIRYNNFLQGLERLDYACIQLDETLMALTTFLQ